MEIGAMSQMAGGVPATGPIMSVSEGADDLVVERFSDVLNARPATEPASAQSTLTINEAQGRTLGDAILSGVNKISGDVRQAWLDIDNGLPQTGDALKMGDMLALQMSVVQFSFLYEVVGKGVSKSVQDLDSLLKMQ